MAFKQLVICVNSKDAEILSDIFFDLGALSVSTEDEFEGTDLEQPIFNEPGMVIEELWVHSKLVVLLDANTNIDKIMSDANAQFGKPIDYTLEIVDDQDWVRLTQSQFEPIKVCDKLYIVPSWHELPDEKATGIILDPGLAFGTGTHATTFMCLKWLAHHITRGDTVLDYGCGSGILAITAKKLGAKDVSGVDIDKQAIESSQYNATTNNVNVDWYLPPQLPNTQFDIVIANILSNPLRMLAPALSNLTRQILVLSGILESQIDELSSIYLKYFANVSAVDIMDGWALLKCENKYELL